MPKLYVYNPPAFPGGKARVKVVHRPHPITDIFLPVVVSLTAVAGILTSVVLLEASAQVPPPRSEPIVFGEAAQPGFRFSRVDPATRNPVRYNPCEPIHYTIDDRVAPPGAVDDTHRAVEIMSSATGIEFVYDGTTDESEFARQAYQPDRYGDRWAPVLIGWHHFGENVLSPTPLGEGGSEARQNEAGDWVYVTGKASLNADAPGVERGFGQGDTWGRILLHELGHVLGLGHSTDQEQLMYPTVTDTRARLGIADRLGLASLGQASGCLSTPTPGPA